MEGKVENKYKHPIEILRKNIEKDDEILRALSRGKQKYVGNENDGHK